MSHLLPLDPDWFAKQPRTPFFCEENVWLLCRDAPWQARMSAVVVANAAGTVAMWAQRAADVDPIIWDYHVVAVVDDDARGPLVVDSDCRSGLILTLPDWLRASFRAGIRGAFLPDFRVMRAADYVDVLASDRRHMRDAHGEPTRPFPPWPPPHPEREGTLSRLIDVDDGIAGVVVELDGLARMFDLPPLELPLVLPESP